MEINREVLGEMIEARALAAMQRYDQNVIVPREQAMHDTNKRALDGLEKIVAALAVKVGEIWDYIQQAKGAYWIIGIFGTLAVILANHYWK